MGKRAAFITIGQSPRADILDEMRPLWRNALTVDEFGVLDGLSATEIEALAPSPGDARLVSRLADGSEVAMSAEPIHERTAVLVRELEQQDYDFLVLLCTGHFERLTSSKLLIKAQPIVDHGLEALATSTSRVGVLVPHPEQMDASGHLTSHASPYEGNRFEEAARELSSAELIVMHCMGYTLAQKRWMAELTGTPVLLAREMVASAASWLIR